MIVHFSNRMLLAGILSRPLNKTHHNGHPVYYGCDMGSHSALWMLQSIPKVELDEIMAEGLRRQVDDLVVLQFDHNRETAGAQQQRPVHSQEILQRPTLGSNVTFGCDLPLGTPPDAVAWLHQDRVVFEHGQPRPVRDGHEYSFSSMDTMLLFRISNISFLSSGSVACVHTIDSTPLKRYMLRPWVTRASQVFQTPMPDQWVTEGDTLTIQCALRLPLSPEVIANDFRLNHMMFRHNGRLLRQPIEAPYGVVRPHRPLGDSQSSGPLEVNRVFRSPLLVQMVVSDIKAGSGTGAAECWFRPHVGLHEWIVQKAMIMVKSRQT